MGNYTLLKVKRENHIATVTLDHPPVNALSVKMLGELGELAAELKGDKETRVVVVTGAGSYAFCAGADVKEFQEIPPAKAAERVKLGQQVFSAIEALPQPVIAAVNSLTLGGGCELAMSCDLRVASDRARFGQPEVWLGLIPAWGGTQRMSRLLGPAKAKELIFTGQMVNAQEAYRIGLVNKIVPDGEEVRAATDIARMIVSKCAPLAVAAAKRAIREGLQEPTFAKALEREVEAVASIAGSADLKEGIEAFIAKRQPDFKGK